jgi:hypothetical protein
MQNIQKIDQRVDVICSFKSKGNTQTLCYPHKMRWKGREVVFKQLGLRHPTIKGKRMVHIFDMSDDSQDYRLEFDAESLTWTLKEVLSC